MMELSKLSSDWNMGTLTSGNTHSLSRYSRQDAINKEWIDGISERSSFTRLAVCPCPFQCPGRARIWRS